jgi:hypothetical protein
MAKMKTEDGEAQDPKPQDAKPQFTMLKGKLSVIQAGPSGLGSNDRDLFVVPEGVVYQEAHAPNPSASNPIAKVGHWINVLVPWGNVAEIRLAPGTTIYGIPVYMKSEKK